MAMVMDLTTTEDGPQDNFCIHYVLEEAGLAPEEEQQCYLCETTWLQRLDDNVERMAPTYTHCLPCLENGQVVPPSYTRCPFCHKTKGSHIAQLIRRLVLSLMEANVPEVNASKQEQATERFDPMLFVAATRMAYPELFEKAFKDWSDLTANRDISGEVFDLISPVYSVHFNSVCTIECSTRSLTDLNQIVSSAYDRDIRSVEGTPTRPKVHVSIPKTQRVKKLIKAAKDANNMVPRDDDVEDAGEVPESQVDAGGSAGPSGSTGNPAVPMPETRLISSTHTSASGNSSSSADQCLLSGEARKQIRDGLAIKKCISFTRPEYAMYLPKLNDIGKRELCCISKSLEILDMMGRQIPVTNIPKWLPKVYISASVKALLDRAGDLVRDVTPQGPVFEASNSNNLPASGFNPNSTPVDPRTTRGGAHTRGPSAHPRGSWVTRGPRGPRGRGRGGYQAQQGYRQLSPYTPTRNPGHRGGRGNLRVIYSSGNPRPSATPIGTQNVAPIQTEGESSQPQGFFTKRGIELAFEARRKDRLTSGASIKCSKTGCENRLQTGPSCLYCNRCGASQQIEETKLYKEEIAKYK